MANRASRSTKTILVKKKRNFSARRRGQTRRFRTLGMKMEGSDELMLRAPFSVDANGSIT